MGGLMTNYGFVIDNRKCIGCHACTVACKSEHDVPIGVNRTYVKYIETGTYPNSGREFSVQRCNHCEDAPCVSICPTTALFTRDDGIVDFDSDRCIGCKSCMQACPYDALYIDPNTSTAAKCNYCAHRVENSYEPACVIVCPTEAIISGDLDDPESNIAMIISEHTVTVRKPDSGAKPNVFYIETSPEMLDPLAAPPQSTGVWTDQEGGVGHFASQAQALLHAHGYGDRMKDVDEENARRVYDTPDKGVLWGWEVSTYIWTKAIAAGTYLAAMLYWLAFGGDISGILLPVLGISLGFLALTGFLLVYDLDRPERFLYVLLRPNWESWLVKGAYILGAYGAVLTASLVVVWFEMGENWLTLLAYAGMPLALLTGVYTAWLLNQAVAREAWTSKWLAPQFAAETLLAGVCVLVLLSEEMLVWVIVAVVALAVLAAHQRRTIREPQLVPLS